MCVHTHLPCPVPRPTWTCTENFGRTSRQSWGTCTSCCSGKVTAETWARCAPTTGPNYCWPLPCLWNGPSRTSLDRLSVHRCTRPTLSTAKYTGVYIYYISAVDHKYLWFLLSSELTKSCILYNFRNYNKINCSTSNDDPRHSVVLLKCNLKRVYNIICELLSNESIVKIVIYTNII